MKNRLLVVLDLYLSFFKIGITTFGGGYAMIPIIQREIVEKKKWMTEEEVIDFYAISQSTPGIISVNIATFIGYKKEKKLGALFSTLGVVTPSIIIITIIAGFISNFQEYTVVQNALKGINISVTVLILFSIIRISKKAIKDKFGIIIAILSFLLVIFLGINTVYIIILSVFIGVFLQVSKIREEN